MTDPYYAMIGLAIPVSAEELRRLLSGEQKAVVRGIATPFPTGTKCFFYENKTGGGRGAFVAKATVADRVFFDRFDAGMKQHLDACCLTQAQREKVSHFRTGTGIIFYFENVVEINAADVLPAKVLSYYQSFTPKNVTQILKHDKYSGLY